MHANILTLTNKKNSHTMKKKAKAAKSVNEEVDPEFVGLTSDECIAKLKAKSMYTYKKKVDDFYRKFAKVRDGLSSATVVGFEQICMPDYTTL